MKTRTKNLAIALFSIVMVFATVFGILSFDYERVSASGTPTVTMLSGASVRKTENEPGIKFTAKIENFVAGNNYQYGMLILPEEAWENCKWGADTQYHAYFKANGITEGQYADTICSPYKDVETGDWCISYSLTNLQSFTRSLVGVAYVFDGTDYTYTKVDMSENSRSIAYVAQMALKHESNLSVEQKNVLRSYANAGLVIEEEDVLTDPSFEIDGDAEYKDTDYALKHSFNVSDEIILTTKEAYASGSEVSFRYFIPNETTSAGWWGIAWNTVADNANNYHAAGAEENYAGHQALSNDLGVWVDVSFTLPAGGPFYLYFGAEVDSNKWNLGEEDSYVLIDDFKVGSVTESFTDDLSESIFNINSGVDKSYVINEKQVGFGAAASEMSAKIFVDKIRSNVGLATFVTKESYPAGSVVKLKYYMPTGVKLGTWAKICCVANANSSDIYANWVLDLPITAGEWIEKEVTLSSAGYLYFAADVGQWGNGEGYVLIDDVEITYNGTTVTESFNYGLEKSIFNVNIADAVAIGDGYVAPEAAELAMQYNFNVTEKPSVSKKAYAGGSTVSFKYFIPNGTTTTGWWGIAWNPVAEHANIYHAAGIEANYVGHYTLGKVTGAWTDVSFTLPSGGPYYLYFGSDVGNNWKVDGVNSYALIDDFTVGEEVETFNGCTENPIFNVSGGALTLGEGYVVLPPTELGEVALKMVFNNNDRVRARTATAYEGGSTVSFKYFIQADTAVQWTRFIWDTDTSCDNYAETFTSFGNTAGEWVTWNYTLPAGGPYYLYFGFECGNWKDSSGAPYILIDDFTVNGEVETFNYGVENSIFTVLQSNLAGNSEIGTGYVSPYPGEYGARIAINSISSEADKPSFITAQKYTLTSATTVTFDYFMSGNTNSKWWAFNWTTSNTVASIYAFVESNPNQQGQALPTTQDSWQTASVDVPAGTWYFYFSGAVGEWGDGYVIIDNFKVGDVVSEDFNNGLGIFLDNASASDTIVITEGKAGATEENPEEPEISYDEKSFTFSDLLGLGKILKVLEEGDGYAYVNGIGEIEDTDLPGSMLLASGYIKYAITGNKEFAISFGNEYYIFVDEDTVAYYKNTEKLAEFAVDGNTEIYFAMTANGRISVSLSSGGYVGLGEMDTLPTCTNLVALGGAGSVIFTKFTVTSFKLTGEVLDNVPQYVSDEAIDFTAYAFDSDGMVSDEGFKLLADAGFTKSMALLQGRVSGLNYNSPSQGEVDRLMAQVNADALKALDLAEKYGLKHYVFNEVLYNLERQTAWYDWVDEIKAAEAYTDHKAFAGHYFADEPTYETTGNSWFGYKFNSSKGELVELVNAYTAYQKAFDSKSAFINLLPLDETVNSLFGDGTAPYTGYIDYYIENIGKEVGYVSYDHYPLVYGGGITDYHLFNLEYVATKGKEAGIELRCYIKASESGAESYSKRATQSINDLYMQIYSALCYGAKEIVYYQFTDHNKKDGSIGDAVVSGTSLSTGDVYSWAKQANNEVRSFEAAYNNFKWVSSSVFGASNTQTGKLTNNAGNYGYISSVSGGTVLVGNFDDADGKYTYGANHAYMIMNYGDTNGATTSTTAESVTFNGTPTRALVYQGGQARVVQLSSNVLTLNLMLGEGAFVIPLI